MKIRSIHPFPARMAPDLALRSLSRLPEGSRVLDPMSGSGTVLRQALALGHQAIGFDMDPLAVLMSRVWTSPVDPDAVMAELDQLLAEASDVDLRSASLDWMDDETSEFMRFWFAPEQRRTLTRLAVVFARRRFARLGTIRRAAVDLLQIALSRIIVTKEQCASLARDTSHSRPHKVADDNDYDVLAGFKRSAHAVLDRLTDHHIAQAATVQLGDARSITLPTHSVDCILSSPPYLNAIDYMRGHRLSLVWLGYSLQQLRAIRSDTIGAERAGTHADENAVARIARAMCDTESLSTRHAAMVGRYASDLFEMMSEITRVLAPSGRAVLIVGNSCLRGQFISNDRGVAQAGMRAGLRLVRRTMRDLPQASRYLPVTSHGSLSKRMRTETVLTFVHA